MNHNKYSASLFRLYLLFTLLALGGCSTFSSKDFTLLTTTSDQQVRVAQQHWQVQHGSKAYAVEVIVERSATQWRWIMLNPLGQRLATVESTGHQIKIERHHSHPANQWLPELLQAWQFSYWPLADLQAANPHWLFVDQEGRREAHFSGILRATIEHQPTPAQADLWQGSLRYHTPEFHLLIQSQSLN